MTKDGNPSFECDICLKNDSNHDQGNPTSFQMRSRISVSGRVRSTVGPSVCSVLFYFRKTNMAIFRCDYASL